MSTLIDALKTAYPGAVIIGDDFYATVSGGTVSLIRGDGEVFAICYEPTISAIVDAPTAEEALRELLKETP